jgi:predicted RecB family nuclease
MIKTKSGYTYSPSDLTLYMFSPFASWMSRFVLEQPHESPDKDEDDQLMILLQQRGYAHEDALEAQLVSEGKTLLKIEAATNQEKCQATLNAMHSGIDVIVQGRLELPPFAGYSDFLIKTPGDSLLGEYHYEVWDTKLSSALKPSFVVQLCCYAQMLEAVQGARPQFITVALGNGEKATLRTEDYYFYYLGLKQTFLDMQAEFTVDNKPDPADSKNLGQWSNYAEGLLLERDHLFQVAGITRGQIKKLNAAGIETMQQLVETTQPSLKGIATSVFRRLGQQASIQTRSKNKEVPEFEIILSDPEVKQGLVLLPAHSALDVFFDIEGFPLDNGGLEYLWGNTYFDEEGKRQFKDFWAHDPIQEKQCFQDFIHWVYGRWLLDSSMHIYHYASYEITACRKLMGRYGVCEHEVDQLLRNEVFVDLYKIVKGGLLVGEPRYSIKNIEHLYRSKRATEVGSGSDSVVVYERWRALNAQGIEGNTWQTSSILKNIRDYNVDDCESTQELVDWLRVQQQAHNIKFTGKSEVVDTELSEEVNERTQLRDRLLDQSEVERKIDPIQASLTENLAWLLEFHRRESKPIFWKLFDRLGSDENELLDDLGCIALCQRTSTGPYKIARSKGYEYRFDINQEFKNVGNSYYVLGAETEGGKNLKVTIDKDYSDFENGLLVVKTTKQAPPDQMSLVPDEYVYPEPIPTALTSVINNYANDLMGECAIIDYLSRATPRIKNHTSGQPIADSNNSDENLKQIINAIVHLDNSYLPIQGPPGSGKTYTGKHVIAKLMQLGKRVGICSNSHKAINNLLLSAAKYCRDSSIVASFTCTRDTSPEIVALGINVETNSDIADCIDDASVVGTTAWGFSRPDMVDKLDYLFIDEAGQVSVANLVAISRSAKNLVVMGDQMQLGQPTQGSHPADSGLSILDYLLHENPTIESSKGVFLATTYRMHSEVNRFISKAVYENKLYSDPANDRQVISVPTGYEGILNKEAGVIFIPVEHQGNTQSSDEEIDQIIKLVLDIKGRTFIDKEKNQRIIDWNDMLFVAPYNHQVNQLKKALAGLQGGEQARVGSVDKFQGQEAPVVFLSMCTSDASESPRGIEFLFDNKRLNVAVSRAQSLAIVLANADLANTPANGIDQLRKVNMFSHLVQFR